MRQLRTIAAIGLALVTHTSGAVAFCRKTTCELMPMPSGCTVNAEPCDASEGLPLYWARPCMSFSVQRDGSALQQISARVFEQQVRAAYDTWMHAACSEGGNPSLVVESYPQAECKDVGYLDAGPNQNLWVFRDADWEANIGAKAVIALTTLSVNEKTGEILDADVELNSTDHAFSTGDETVETDLLSIVQHESGHVLGIDHSRWGSSTMGDSYVTGTTDKRTLADDDIAAVCTIYPPGAASTACDSEPLGGFSVDCTEPAQRGCCSIAPSRTGSGHRVLLAAALFVVVQRGRRRRAIERNR